MDAGKTLIHRRSNGTVYFDYKQPNEGKKLMRIHFLTTSFFILFISCKNNDNLVEVQIPEPEVIIETSSSFGNPNDIKTETGPFEYSSRTVASIVIVHGTSTAFIA